MIVGLGIDMCGADRFADADRRERFAARFFTDTEREHVASRGLGAAQSAAGIFAAKEAAFKALGVGIGQISLTDISLSYSLSGAPTLTLQGKARDIAQSLGVRRMHVSITHENNVAAAVVIVEGE